MKTQMPVRRNFNPTPEEMAYRRAIHILSDATEDFIIVKIVSDVYLVASILGNDHEDYEEQINCKVVLTPRPEGTVQYQVSDGLPDHRSHSNDFYNLADALAFLDKVVGYGGWYKYIRHLKRCS